ncbi:MAG: metallophosphoesterase [Planctomycetaceae bacterium]|nr:metallophosphoesterase [Planctomycetaceae bacterium]
MTRDEFNPDRSRGGRLSRSRRPGGSKLGGYEVPPPANNVPDHLHDIILGRPTNDSITACVLAYDDLEGYLAYGIRSGQYSSKSDLTTFAKDEPVDVVLQSLEADTRYYYRLNCRKPEAKVFEHSDEFQFHTQRATGSPFTFTVQSDSHLDENTSGEVYTRTLTNALRDSPDFHFALGDTFMTGKYVRPELSHGQYLAQRYYFGQLCHSSPLFFALGNHDGESGNRGSNLWATQTRKRYLPNPFPNGFYSGNEREERSVGFPENYFAWEWGNSQFIVLDPFRHTTSRSRSGDNWYRTLGKDQYQWLKATLERSSASFRFVFLHHLIGGADRNSRGGIEAVPYFEWGGKSLGGTDDFDRQRPGWGKPIHSLLVEHDVTIVFHGHDHMYVKQDLDGIVYQLVPQPGHPRFGNTRSAREYGYVNGVVLSSSGHLRVRVAHDSVRVDYVRAYLPRSESSDRKNGDVSHSYLIKGK